MRLAISLFVLLLAAVRPIQAQLPDSAQTEFLADLHSLTGMSEMVKRVRDGEIETNTVRVIAEILRNTSEVESHRMRGGKDNVVYLSPNGRQEAVFDGNGKLVQDGINDSSYNYFHPQTDALRHFTFDIAPWLLYGRSRDDPTTRGERVHAYAADVLGGVIRALGAPRTDGKHNDVSLDEPGCAEAIAVFLLAIEHGNAEELIRVVGLQEKAGDRELVPLVKEFGGGLQKLFASDRDGP